MTALFTAGFRPFFLAAAGWSVLAMAAWLPLLFGVLDLPTRFDPLSLHIHEMLFGFIMAAVGGFLLTAIANWTNRPPVAGRLLGALLILWLLGRLACVLSALIPGWLAAMLDVAFPVALECVAARELFAVGNRRNYPLLLPLIVLAIANLLTHLQVLGADVPINLGWRQAIASVVMLIGVIGGRIIPTFTRNWLTARGTTTVPPESGGIDQVALALLLAAMLVWCALPDARVNGVLLLAAAAAHLIRLSRWHGIATRAEPLLLILHVGYLWLVLGLLLLGLSLLSDTVPPAAAVHALTAGAMATMILGVMTRATLGHTGRTLRADGMTAAVFVLINIAAALRVIASWTVEIQTDLLQIAVLAWLGAFVLFLADYAPMLLAPRR